MSEPTNSNVIETLEKQIAHFWQRINRDGPVPAQRPELGQCWLWTGGGNGQGARPSLCQPALSVHLADSFI